jgi:hypothetical protein
MGIEQKMFYEDMRRQDFKDKFMQKSRIASNMCIINETVYSKKFETIKQFIIDHPNDNHLIFSNFVEAGSIAFSRFCA